MMCLVMFCLGCCRSMPIVAAMIRAPVVVDRTVDFTRTRPSSVAKRNAFGVLLLLEPESCLCCCQICTRRPVGLLLIFFLDVLVVVLVNDYPRRHGRWSFLVGTLAAATFDVCFLRIERGDEVL